MKFKIGDKVRVIGVDGYLDRFRGKIGIITNSCDDEEWIWNIQLDNIDKDGICLSQKEIEHTVQPNEQMLFDFMEN